ncbi:hypothetical protein ACFE04_019367 [Oxalis oulophora]
MSITQYPDAFNATELQVWNNAAFDVRDSVVDSVSIFKNVDDRSDSSKENWVDSPIQVKSPVFDRSPLRVNNNNNAMMINSGFKIVSKQSLLVDKSTTTTISDNGSEEDKLRDQRKIDMEIEEIEGEISRLSTRLKALRFEKLEQSVKSIEKRGKIVAAKFMEPRQSSNKNTDSVKKTEEKNLVKVSNRRGLSLGPAEIYSAAKSRRQTMLLTSKPDITPVVSTQNRRKSCFFKLEGINEEKVTKQRGKSSSVSPKAHKTVSKIPAPKQSMTTIGSRKVVRKEDGIISSIQPRKLFVDVEKSTKKPIKPGRFVASRYNQMLNQGNGGNSVASEARKRSLTGNSVPCEVRKRSLPENAMEESNKRRTSLENSRVKKKWDIPNEVVICKEGSVSKIGDVALPKIKTLRFVNQSPRDSGAAKRVAELVGRKSYFGADEGEAKLVGQALTFEEGEEDDFEDS